MPLNWLLDKLLKEWPMISQAPFTFLLVSALSLLIAFSLATALVYFLFRVRLSSQDAIIGMLREKRQGSPEVLPTESWLSDIERNDRLELHSVVYVVTCRVREVLTEEHAYVDFL